MARVRPRDLGSGVAERDVCLWGPIGARAGAIIASRSHSLIANFHPRQISNIPKNFG
jgi:hypothetical protein